MNKVAGFLQGGRYSGDRGSIVAPAPEVLLVTPCDCSPAQIEEPCGMPTHWHDLEKADELGDAPRHAAYYVKVHEQPAHSGMTAALYWYAGHDRPTHAELANAHEAFAKNARVQQAGLTR